MEEMKLTDTETSVHDELDLIPFTDPKLSKIPTDFDFELENPKLLKDKLIEHDYLPTKGIPMTIYATGPYEPPTFKSEN